MFTFKTMVILNISNMATEEDSEKIININNKCMVNTGDESTQINSLFRIAR